MAVFLYQNRLVASLEQMAGSAVKLIEELSIHTVELPHADGKIAVRRLDQAVLK